MENSRCVTRVSQSASSADDFAARFIDFAACEHQIATFEPPSMSRYKVVQRKVSLILHFRNTPVKISYF
jgi:hypothetical protein